ncbi:dihydrofolate reductase family protein [Streptomyces melanogenes]|uniref:dihydrofolate reductase family protein n=1 Tax=Streptomyces melanogenes TaxID=67326 RepID=UPI00167EFE8C|nr:dihydrofolate reductase family protein [Streptomyces melanogenes]GGP53238.1 deaminase [Streptomyces melanogenes]
MRKLSYYIALTIDGFIAAPDGSYDFYPLSDELFGFMGSDFPEALPTPARRALGVDETPNRRYDTVLMGRGTYEPGLKAGMTSPYAHLRQIVFSRGLGESPDPAVEIVSGDPVAFVRELKREEGADIYLCGGADLAGQLVDEIDELVIKSYPVVAGAGIPLFRTEFTPRSFVPTDSRSFENGTVVTTYARKR